MKFVTLLLVVCVVGVSHAFLGAQRKRVGWRNEPAVAPARTDPARTSMPKPLPPPTCCKKIYEQRIIDPGFGVNPGSQPDPGFGDSNIPMIPKPPNPSRYTYQVEDYMVNDILRQRPLSYFDPEFWVSQYPNSQFPSELDIPFGWSIYNPVTVQAPKPLFPDEDLRAVRYTGYYYACPNRVNPYHYSWFFLNEAINPCKWTLYQTKEDATVTDLIPYYRW